MHKQEAYEYYEAAVKQELGFADMISEKVAHTPAAFPPVASTLLHLLYDREGVFPTNYLAPLPSLQLISESYDVIGVEPQLAPEYLDFIGRILLPMSRIPNLSNEPVRVHLGDARAETCADAEDRFAETVTQVSSGKPENVQQRFVSVVYDEVGRPLILQKSETVHSGLTLAPMTFTTFEEAEDSATSSLVHMPVGTIVAIDTRGLGETCSYESSNGSYTYSVVKIDQPFVTPCRVSPWAYSDRRARGAFAIRINQLNQRPIGFDQRRADLLESLTIADFQKAATKVMRLCGVPIIS
jgi:hypothetical protein